MTPFFRQIGVFLLITAMVCAPGSLSTSAGLPEPATLRTNASAWGTAEVVLTARMITHRGDQDPTTVDLRILRSGRTRTRIDFLSPPKDKGKVLLQLDGQAWLYLPRADRVVKIPPRRHLLADGLLFEDLFADQPDLADARVEESESAYILVTASEDPSGAKMQKSTRIYFDRNTLLPFQRDFYSASGKLLRTIHIEETRPWNGLNLPWKIRFVDHLRQNAETTLEVLSAENLPDQVEDLFSRKMMAKAPSDTVSPADD